MNIARVTEAHRTNFTIATEGKEFTATVRGVFHADGDFPKVGDYVVFTVLDDEKAVIESVLERSSVIKRKSADTDEEQIIATNVNLIFIVMGLDGDFNISRMERYLLLAEQSKILSVVVLNKADVVDDIAPYMDEVTKAAGQAPVLVASALTGEGMEKLSSYITIDTTSVLLGSSGAGKSTITNWLLREERQAVKDIRPGDSHGRHTTTSRQLFTLPNGGYLIDTPGMRELGVFESDAEDEQAVFERIEHFASHCQFRNCDHEKSAGCAVQIAIENSELTEREFHNYKKLLRERAFLESKDTDNAARYSKQNEKRQQQKYEADKRQRLSRGL
jgi:ribosome biogenesis GTPase